MIAALLLFLPGNGQDIKPADKQIQLSSEFSEIDTKLELCYQLRYTSPDSAMKYCREALLLSGLSDYEGGKIRANLLMGILHDVSSRYDSALFYYRASLALSHAAGDTLKVASNNANMGLTFYNMGNFREAVEYFYNSLGYFEQAGYNRGIASTFNNLGMIYKELSSFEKSLEFYQKALEISQGIDDKNGIGATLTNMGEAFYHLDSLEMAKKYLEESIEVKSNIGDHYGLSISYSTIARVLFKQGKLPAAEEYIEKAIEMGRLIESKSLEVNAYLIFQKVLVEKGHYQEAISINRRCLQMASEIGSLKSEASALRNLSSIFETLGNTAKAFDYFKKFIEKKDELVNQENLNQVFQFELDYEREKQATEIDLLNRQAQIDKLEIERQRLLIGRRNAIIIAILTLFLVGLLLAYLYYVQQKNRQNLKLNKTLSDLQKQAAKGAIEAEINERQRIGEELHDSFGQILSLIKLNLTKVQTNNDLPVEKRERIIDHAVSLANKAFVDLRAISHNMSPIMLKTKGLTLSIKDLLDRIKETSQYTINFEAVNMDGHLQPMVEFTLFRSVQELLNNVINHAKASDISVQMIKDEENITIMVEDNGRGFDDTQINTFTGMGLRNTISRINNLGGEMIIDSSLNRGTIITIIVPQEIHEGCD